MPERSDEEIDELLRETLPPPPASWVTQAEELPRLERALCRLEELPSEATDSDMLREVLEQVGLAPSPERIRALTRMRDGRSRR